MTNGVYTMMGCSSIFLILRPLLDMSKQKIKKRGKSVSWEMAKVGTWHWFALMVIVSGWNLYGSNSITKLLLIFLVSICRRKMFVGQSASFLSCWILYCCYPFPRLFPHHIYILLNRVRQPTVRTLDSSFRADSWDEGIECCKWEGVMCDKEGNVVGLDLSCSGLNGSLQSNSALFSLQNLQWLNLARDDFC